MTLLVPTDFSKASRAAVFYAIALARKLNADIQLLHIVQANPSTETLMKWKRLEEEMIRIAREDADALMADIQKSIRGKKPPISFHLKQGYDFTTLINRFAEEHDADMIIMGTTGATGLKRVLLGSNAAALINEATVPVVAVPASAQYKPVKRIVYASDLKHTEEEIKTIALFAQLLKAQIDVIHVTQKKSADLPDAKAMAKELQTMARYKKVTFHIVKSGNVARAIDAYIRKHKADMLATFTHKLDFFEKLFGKGITRKLAYHIRVPMLAFNKSTLK
jgi:nucleotide-binding universal stress UspA family protein